MLLTTMFKMLLTTIVVVYPEELEMFLGHIANDAILFCHLQTFIKRNRYQTKPSISLFYQLYL